MSGMIERRIATAIEIRDWLVSQGQRDRASQMGGIRLSLTHFQDSIREAQALRKRLTPIGQARVTEARRALADELRTGADLLERMAKIAETGGEGPVGIEAVDAAYLADLLRRAAV